MTDPHELFRLGKIEEYKSLRAEIAAIISRQGQQQLISWGATLALLTASWVSGFPELAMLSILFVSVAWRDYLRLTSSISRLGGYIAACIEPCVQGLEWESNILRFYRKHVLSRGIYARVRVAYTSHFGILIIIALTVSIAQLAENFPDNTSRRVLAAVLSILSLWSLIHATRIAISVPQKRVGIADEWEKEFAGKPK